MSLVAVRSALIKYPGDQVISAFPTLYYATMYGTAMQMGCTDCISPPNWSDLGDAAFTGEYDLATFDRVINLDGPEIAHAHETNYDLTKNRIECFCDEVGIRPDNMVPYLHIEPRDRMALVDNRLRRGGLEPFSYLCVHYKSAEPFKDYPHTDDLICAFRDMGHKVVVIHDGTIPDFSLEDKPVYYTSRLMASEVISLLSMAKMLICPDSSMLHAAAAVGCPTLALFSGTPGVLTCRYYPLATVLQNTDVSGHPCAGSFPCFGLHKRNFWCSERDDLEDSGKPWCLEQISPIHVVAKTDELLEQNAAYTSKRAQSLAEELHELRMVKIDRNAAVPGKQKVLVVGCPPGIGDSLWAMTKIKSIMQEDGADGLVVVLQKTQPARGREFIKRFSFVDECLYQDFPIHPLGQSHINPDGTYNYCPTQRDYLGMDWLLIPNAPLERGERLETWLPEFPIDWNVGINDFRFEQRDLDVADSVSKRAGGAYAVFFLGAKDSNTRAGHNREHRYTKSEWTRYGYLPELYDGYEPRSPFRMSDWISLAKMIVTETGLSIVIVGARYDSEFAREFVAAWESGGNDKSKVVNLSGTTQIGETFSIIKQARCMFSYQAGTGIHSVMMGCCTAIWWRAQGDSLEPAANRLVSFQDGMNAAWAPPWSLTENGSYMPLIYARQSPLMIFEESVKRRWFDKDRPRGRDLLNA